MCLLQFWFVVVMSTIMENKDQKINAPKMPSVPFKYLVLAISHELYVVIAVGMRSQASPIWRLKKNLTRGMSKLSCRIVDTRSKI